MDLDRAAWNSTLLERDLFVGGSAELAQTLAAHDLVDEYRLIVYPVVLENRERLFTAEETSLDLVDVRPFTPSSTELVYRPSARGTV